MDTMVVLCCITLVLISICCVIYIHKEIMGAIKGIVKALLKDIGEDLD